MGAFDQASHYALKADPAGFFAWRVPRFVGRYRFVGWADTTTVAFPGDPDRVCDTVAVFEPRDGAGPRRLLDVEFQTEPDGRFLERDGEYLFRLRRELPHGPGPPGRFLVTGMLIGLTGPPQADVLDTREDTLDGAGILFRVVQCALREGDARATLARIASGELAGSLLFWVPLMRGAGDADVIDEWLRLAAREPDAGRRGDYGGIAKVFAELVPHRDAWHTALRGWNMKESQSVLEWQREAREEGRQEGELIRQRAVILRALGQKFGEPVPADLADAVARADDLAQLEAWFDAALAAADLAAFRAAVGRPAPPSANGVNGPPP